MKIEEQSINLLELLHVLVRRKMLIVKVCTLAAVVSVAYSLTLTNRYAATAKVLPPQKEVGGGLSALLGQAGALAALAPGLGGGSDLYLGIFKSRSVADAVIAKLDLQRVYKAKDIEAARTKLAAAVKVQAGKDGIISVTAEDADPRRAAVLANTFVEELVRTTVRLNLTKAGTERLFLEKRLELVRKDLKAAEDELKAFAQQNKVVQVDSQAKASIEGVARLKSELVNKEVQLAVLRGKQTDQSPEVKALQATINSLRRQLGAMAGNNSSSEGIPSVGDVPALGLQYARKMRELKVQEALFEQLTKQYEMAKLSEAKDSSALQVLDEAVVPLKKSKPSRAAVVLLTTLSVFFLCVIGLLVQHFLGRLPQHDQETIESIKKEAFTIKGA